MVEYFKTRFEVFIRYRYLLKNLVERDIKVKYRRSALGLIWSVLNPLLMMLVLTAVFSYMFKQQIEYFPVYLLSGQLIFNFFSEATNLAMDSLLANAGLIKKVYIPKYIFPFEKVIFSLVNVMFSLIPLVGVIIVMRVPVTPWILLSPIPILFLFIFNLGAGMILASLVVFFRDIKHLYGIILLALTYMTPIFYPESLLPERVQWVIRLNPIYWFVGMFRQVVLYGKAPTAIQWMATSFSAIILFIIGLFIFKKTQDRFILYI